MVKKEEAVIYPRRLRKRRGRKRVDGMSPADVADVHWYGVAVRAGAEFPVEAALEARGLVAIAQIETVGRTAGLVVRKDLGITKASDLRGKKIANQTGSSIGNIFVDQVLPDHGLKKGDYQEVRMNVNDMIAAMAAKTVDAMVNIEPYNAITEADGIGTSIVKLVKLEGNIVFVRGLDCLDETPLLDIKPDRCEFSPLSAGKGGGEEAE